MFQPDDSFRKHIIRTKGPALGISHKRAYCMFLVPLKLLDMFAFWFTLPWKAYLAAVMSVFIITGATMLHSTAPVKKENIVNVLKRRFV